VSAELLARALEVVADDEAYAKANGTWDPDRVLRLCAGRRKLLEQYDAWLTVAPRYRHIAQVVDYVTPWVRAIADEGDDK
jgi:hypothetical protein